MRMNVDGSSVLVLGGTSGMGFATARALLDAGANVSIVGRDPAKASAAARELGGPVSFGAFDAGDTESFAEHVAAMDSIDHVVSFTGEQPAAPVGEADHEMFQRAFDARVWAARNACAIAGPRMGEGGSFVFCSGVSAFRPRPGRSAGAVATAALESFTRAMAVELAPLRVNSICPGAFDTEVLRRAFGNQADEVIARLEATVPMGRIGRPAEIAHAVIFLLTNTYTTGIVLRVDGGSVLV
jgi:NAD(P)-dependent dehydrogenase (short-subunit alcohol dehydrogenase family)